MDDDRVISINGPVRVLLADDHPLYRQGLAGFLAAATGIEVVAEVASGDAAVARATEVAPHVCVLDHSMPGLTGVEATRLIRERVPEAGVLILTMFDSDETVFQAMRAGARGFLVKTDDPEIVVDAIRTVARGGAVFSAGLAARLAEWFTALETAGRPHFPDLTPREREVLELLADGLPTRSIARRLGVQDKTIRNIVSVILAKLQVPDRAAAVARARGHADPVKVSRPAPGQRPG